MALACGGGSRFLAGFLARAGDMPSPPRECASALSRLISRSCNRCANRKSSLLIDEMHTKVNFLFLTRTEERERERVVLFLKLLGCDFGLGLADSHGLDEVLLLALLVDLKGVRRQDGITINLMFKT
jgi:hypothetical protein